MKLMEIDRYTNTLTAIVCEVRFLKCFTALVGFIHASEFMETSLSDFVRLLTWFAPRPFLISRFIIQLTIGYTFSVFSSANILSAMYCPILEFNGIMYKV